MTKTKKTPNVRALEECPIELHAITYDPAGVDAEGNRKKAPRLTIRGRQRASTRATELLHFIADLRPELYHVTVDVGEVGSWEGYATFKRSTMRPIARRASTGSEDEGPAFGLDMGLVLHVEEIDGNPEPILQLFQLRLAMARSDTFETLVSAQVVQDELFDS